MKEFFRVMLHYVRPYKRYLAGSLLFNLLSAVLNGEPLFRWQYLAALVFVCVGIWLVNKAPAQKEKV